MSARTNKRRVADLFCGRFDGPVRWRSAEDQEWMNAVPIGREFGSKDYERLSVLDRYSWGTITEQEAMCQLGVDHHGLAAMVEADGLEPPEVDSVSCLEVIEGRSTRNEVGHGRALKGMFGKRARTVSIEEMNPIRRKP